MIDIFNFEDFHVFFQAIYKDKKEGNKYFSYTLLANKWGIGNRTFAHHIVNEAKTKLPAPYIAKIAEALHLTKTETDYFNLMVSHTHCVLDGNVTECMVLKKKMDAMRNKVHHEDSPRDRDSCFSLWYNNIIRPLPWNLSVQG